MTEPAPDRPARGGGHAAPASRPARWPRGRVRATAWVTGAATFLGSVSVLGVAPKPDSAGATVDVRAASDDGVRRRVIRRIVIVEAPSADADDPVHVEVTPASSDVGAAAPAAPAPVVTGGS